MSNDKRAFEALLAETIATSRLLDYAKAFMMAGIGAAGFGVCAYLSVAAGKMLGGGM